MSNLYSLTEFITRLAYLNLLWILFSLGGLIIFGIAPSTVALFAVIRKSMIHKDKEFSVFKEYFGIFKKEFLRSNILGIFLGVFVVLIWINFNILKTITVIPNILLVSFFAFLLVICLVIFLYVFPVYVHFDITLKKVISTSLILGVGNFFYTLFMVLGLYIIYRILLFIPGIIPFLGTSMYVYFVMWLSLKVFGRSVTPN